MTSEDVKPLTDEEEIVTYAFRWEEMPTWKGEPPDWQLWCGPFAVATVNRYERMFCPNDDLPWLLHISTSVLHTPNDWYATANAAKAAAIATMRTRALPAPAPEEGRADQIGKLEARIADLEREQQADHEEWRLWQARALAAEAEVQRLREALAWYENEDPQAVDAIRSRAALSTATKEPDHGR